MPEKEEKTLPLFQEEEPSCFLLHLSSPLSPFLSYHLFFFHPHPPTSPGSWLSLPQPGSFGVFFLFKRSFSSPLLPSACSEGIVGVFSPLPLSTFLSLCFSTLFFHPLFQPLPFISHLPVFTFENREIGGNNKDSQSYFYMHQIIVFIHE